MPNPYASKRKPKTTPPLPKALETVMPSEKEVPAIESLTHGSVLHVLDRVGDDKDKAAQALVEEKSGKKRATLIRELEEILKGN